MKKHIKRLPLYIVTGIVAILLIIWCASLIKCEVLTSKYFDDFEYAYKSNKMIDNVEYFKVLKCDGETAEVYYVSDTNGDILKFKKQDNAWVETEWETVWSKNGSASDVVWPYWWQFFITGA